MGDINGTLSMLFAIPAIVPSVISTTFWLVVLWALYFCTDADFRILKFRRIWMASIISVKFEGAIIASARMYHSSMFHLLSFFSFFLKVFRKGSTRPSFPEGWKEFRPSSPKYSKRTWPRTSIIQWVPKALWSVNSLKMESE